VDVAVAGIISRTLWADLFTSRLAGLFTSMQARAADYLYQANGDPGGDIVIVAIDEKSQQALGEYPLTLDYHAHRSYLGDFKILNLIVITEKVFRSIYIHNFIAGQGFDFCTLLNQSAVNFCQKRGHEISIVNFHSRYHPLVDCHIYRKQNGFYIGVMFRNILLDKLLTVLLHVQKSQVCKTNRSL